MSASRKIKKDTNPSARIEVHRAIASSSEGVEHPEVQPKLAVFNAFGEKYLAAHQRVLELVEARRIHGRKVKASQGDVIHQLKMLARHLSLDGRSTSEVFTPFQQPVPYKIARLRPGKLVNATRELSEAVHRTPNLPQSTVAVAAQLAEAAGKLEASLAQTQGHEDAYKTAVQQRDAIGREWDSRYDALKHQVLALEAQGVSGLRNRLFGAITTGSPRKKSAGTTPHAPTPPQATTPPAPQAAPSAPAPAEPKAHQDKAA